MSVVIQKNPLKLITRSGHTPAYVAEDHLFNAAGFAALNSGNVPEKYWKLISGDTDVGEMTQGEKNAYDAANPPIVVGTMPASGTTAERDSIISPSAGMIWNNTTTNQLERYNGTAWVAVGGDGWETLSVQDISSQATVDFTEAAHFDGTYKALELRFFGVNSTVDNTNLILRFNMGVWKTADYTYHGEARRGLATQDFSSDSSSGIIIIGSTTYKMGTGTGEKFDGEIKLGNPSTTDQDRACPFEVWGEGQDTGHGAIIRGGGGWFEDEALEGLRLIASSGLLNGRFVLLGHKMI